DQRDASSAASPRPSTTNRTRSPGAGNLVVMLLPVITIMSRSSARPRRLSRFASHATASKGWPIASPVLPWPSGRSLIQQCVPAVSRSTRRQSPLAVPRTTPPPHAAVPRVLRDQREGVQLLVVGVTVLDQLERRQARGDAVRHRGTGPRLRPGGQRVAQAYGDLELRAQVVIGAHVDSGRRGEHHA